MGGFATLHFGLRYPQRALSLCIGGLACRKSWCGGQVIVTIGIAHPAESLGPMRMPVFTVVFNNGRMILSFNNSSPWTCRLSRASMTTQASRPPLTQRRLMNGTTFEVGGEWGVA
jgi:hypothetical protein